MYQRLYSWDIADAHTKALEYLKTNDSAPSFDIINLGTGNSVSVLEAISAFEKVSGEKLNYEVGPAKDGDVVAIYAYCSKALNVLG